MSPYYRILSTGPSSDIDDPQRQRPPWGYWTADSETRVSEDLSLADAVQAITRDLFVIDVPGEGLAVAEGGRVVFGESVDRSGSYPIVAHARSLTPRALGDRSFCADHGVEFPYVAGAMANGIGSVELVEAMGRAGLLAFFGSAGLTVNRVEQAIDRLSAGPSFPFGFNLIHSPAEPRLEAEIVDLYLRKGVRSVEASAFLDLTLPLVRYRVSGIHRDQAGRVVLPNRLIGKVSRVEVASKFLSPPPEALLRQLVESGDIDSNQMQLARQVPLAEDLTAEADSGGHTDNRSPLVLLPLMLSLAQRIGREQRYDRPLRVGAAGGIATPTSVSAAFAMGAAYVVTGSINQACIESGSSDEVRALLCQAEQADVTMAPAADMFEMGVQVQVLKRGTMFPMRARKLFELYRNYDSVEAIPAAERATVEKTLFRMTFDDVWAHTRSFFEERDGTQVEKSESDPHHKLALICRWYLGLSSVWANSGEATRRIDYQVWCGPAMGAFNEWVRGSFLEEPGARKVATVALNLLFGAAVMHRVNSLRVQGVSLPTAALNVGPRSLENLEHLLGQST